MTRSTSPAFKKSLVPLIKTALRRYSLEVEEIEGGRTAQHPTELRSKIGKHTVLHITEGVTFLAEQMVSYTPRASLDCSLGGLVPLVQVFPGKKHVVRNGYLASLANFGPTQEEVDNLIAGTINLTRVLELLGAHDIMVKGTHAIDAINKVNGMLAGLDNNRFAGRIKAALSEELAKLQKFVDGVKTDLLKHRTLGEAMAYVLDKSE
ncbi:hypothetical protein HYT84_01670 [Candidatus Micrarchaeota archaeon]|nr:hypothetical protein [Candidatus Micrarchaeota archaeon]